MMTPRQRAMDAIDLACEFCVRRGSATELAELVLAGRTDCPDHVDEVDYLEEAIRRGRVRLLCEKFRPVEEGDVK